SCILYRLRCDPELIHGENIGRMECAVLEDQIIRRRSKLQEAFSQVYPRAIQAHVGFRNRQIIATLVAVA
ncbi:unnamed protein product, partial [Amoebophrya sp. A25]